MKSNKITFLENHKEDLQKGIWGLEFDIRYLQRQKLTCKEGEIIELENAITTTNQKIKHYKSRIELLNDCIAELNDKNVKDK